MGQQHWVQSQLLALLKGCVYIPVAREFEKVVTFQKMTSDVCEDMSQIVGGCLSREDSMLNEIVDHGLKRKKTDLSLESRLVTVLGGCMAC